MNRPIQIHVVLWEEAMPKLETDSTEDNLVMISMPELYEELTPNVLLDENYIALQNHIRTRICLHKVYLYPLQRQQQQQQQ
jgi:hypothetical protein